MDTYELARLLNNLIRLGTVTEVRHGQPSSVRVKTGELTTNWIPFMAHRAGNIKTWSPPSVGEQVVLMAPGGDLVNAIALTGVYSDYLPEPSSSPNEHVIIFPDGARMQYDHDSGAMSITGIKSLTINASSEITINCPNSYFKGNVIQQGGVLSSNGVVLDSHVHTGVSPGAATTGGPV